MWIFLALIVVPLIEIALFIKIGGWLGFWPTICVVILTAMAGVALLSMQGTATLVDLQKRLVEGGDPRSAIAHGILIFVAGVLLVVPGFFTDVIGFLFLIRPVRTIVILAAIRNLDLRMRTNDDEWSDTDAAGTTIDGEYVEVASPEGREAPGGDRRERSARWIDPQR